MAKVVIPKSIGKVWVAMGLGGKWMVWNGKHGKGEFNIACKSRAQANAVTAKVNALQDKGGLVETDG